MKLSDYVMGFLRDKGVDTVFMVSGGGIMHLTDSLGRTEGMEYVCNYHEQACAISAEAYARVNKRPAACLVTVGPGAVNALSGILGAWMDSLPMIVISGQVRTQIMADFSKVRQMGPQESNLVDMARPVTKYAVSVKESSAIKYELEKAFYHAFEGRPGPVWLEIPLDIQSSEIDVATLKSFEAQKVKNPVYENKVSELVQLIKKSKRPIVVAGNGVAIGHARQELVEFIEKYEVPVVMPYSAKDLLPETHPQNMGVFGTAGQRRANFAVQNSDLVIGLGAGFCISKVGFAYKGFAPKAQKVIVDIDEAQVFHQILPADLGIVADAKEVLQGLLKALGPAKLDTDPKWSWACQMWKEKYPIILPEYFEDKDHVNSYVFMDVLSDLMANKSVITVGNGLDCVSYYQAFKIKSLEQRGIISGNWGSMGWDLPLAIGACYGMNRAPVVCVTGDGSLQWNVQELMTIAHNKLPIKVFVFNNNGYSAIRITQKTFNDGLFVGSDEGSGVGNPDFKLLAQAYGLKYRNIDNNGQVKEVVREVLGIKEPVLIEVKINPEQWITPKASAFKRADGTLESRPLEDMSPFLPREEIEYNMGLFEK